MNTLLGYLLKSAIYLAAFYLVYLALLSRDKSYSRNRAYILLSLLASAGLPFIAIPAVTQMTSGLFGTWLPNVVITAGQGEVSRQAFSVTPSLIRIIASIYLCGFTLFMSKFIFDLANLMYLIARHSRYGTRIIRFHRFNTSGFSAMGYIFINSGLTPEEETEIIRHEENHLSMNHFVDIILVELVKAFQWFNPAIYFFNRSLRAIHEYQADQECLRSGASVASYQNLLFRQVFKSGSLNLSNSFSNPSLIKKRMLMMTRKPASSLANTKLLLAIPVLGLAFIIISASGKSASGTSAAGQSAVSGINSSDIDEVPFVAVEEMPMFPGGDEALLRYIAENTKYPENAKKNSVTGKVIVRFCVTATGAVNRVSILQGVDPELDEEAMRVSSSLPKFKPGRQGGKNVPVWYMVPITFTLK